ncbi:hypothetical protein [Nocardioides sp. SLBN-35]|uniref:hypothetical protein n=1 Tax=Nocardioides sp. SLBN-35 TaxID=2768445 RepID=UPI001166E026|nr:hypothetical protein [Nocardioides sp. SLBN-35]TQK73349.1 hypothetical protein FBY23_5181 [Nocardioides sp. SLBN-35]
MQIHAARRKKADPEAEVIPWSIEAPEYDDDAKAEIRSAVADDEVLLFVRPDR